MSGAAFAITQVRLFDGDAVSEGRTVQVRNGLVQDIDGVVKPGTPEIDGLGMTLLPGLIDAHAHAKPGALEQAIAFGVTTEMDLGSSPEWMDAQRELAASRNDVADVRSTSFGATVPGNHPSVLIGSFFPSGFPTVERPEDAQAFVDARIDEGADLIKFLVEDYQAWPRPAVPRMPREMSDAIVEAAHRRGMLTMAHVTNLDCAMQAVDSGVDGLAHLFMDQVAMPDSVERLAERDVFVVPTMVFLGGISLERTGARVAEDPRTAGLLPKAWHDNLCCCFPENPHASFEAVLETVAALREGGVRVLAGTDTARVGTLGTAHGVSVHDDMRLLAQAGYTPSRACAPRRHSPPTPMGWSTAGASRPDCRPTWCSCRAIRWSTWTTASPSSASGVAGRRSTSMPIARESATPTADQAAQLRAARNVEYF